MSGGFRMRGDVRYRLVRSEAVVLKQEEGETLVLNEVAARILQLLERGGSVSEVVGQLLGEFEVGEEELREDVTEFAAELVDAGVLEPMGGGDR